MESLSQVLPAAVAALLRDAPLSPGKVALAWKAAVGPALARVTDARLLETSVLEVTVADPHWRREVRRLAPLIRERLAALLGPDTVTQVAVVGAGATRHRQPTAPGAQAPTRQP